jgi:hypothetical protein
MHGLVKTYVPVGRCIYCGVDEWSLGTVRKLGDEHIIPEGLGGKLVLPQASCKSCEKETSRFELEWLRGAYYAARVQKGLGKKKKRPPTHLPLKVEAAGRSVVKQIRIDKFPAMVVTLLFDRPGVLFGIDTPRKGLSGGVAIGTHVTFGEHLGEHLAQGTVTFESPRASATSRELGRMLAKIAHAYAVAELGLGAFKPHLLPIIMGTDLTDLAHYVGGTRKLPTRTDAPYAIDLKEVTSDDHRSYLMVTVRLLADMTGLPEYWIVVGELAAKSDELRLLTSL